MGDPMVRALLRAGHSVAVCDVDPGAVERLVADGAAAADTPAGAAAGADAVITMLPTPAIVREAWAEPDGVLAAEPAPGVAIDMSTGPPKLARELAEAGARAGLDVLDAPVSGGPPGARAGTLAIMVGGTEEAFERARPLFDAMGGLVAHMGAPGTGQATKLCNNLLAGVHMAALAESVALARREGLDGQALFDVLTHGTGDSRVLRMRFPEPGVVPEAPVNREFAPNFPVDLIVKDLRLAIEAAQEHGVEPTVAGAALARYLLAAERDLGGLDYSAVVRLLEES
jgi:3-hydroxyisobutyrate dehydrogenase